MLWNSIFAYSSIGLYSRFSCIVQNAIYINPYSAGIDFRRQILTSKVDPRTVIVKIFMMAVDP